MRTEVAVVATDNAGNTAGQLVTVNVTDLDEVNPSITGPSGAAGDATSIVSIEKNATAVYTFTADEAVTWSLEDGNDKDKFAIDETTGALSFVNAPDYENPGIQECVPSYSATIMQENCWSLLKLQYEVQLHR